MFYKKRSPKWLWIWPREVDVLRVLNTIHIQTIVTGREPMTWSCSCTEPEKRAKHWKKEREREIIKGRNGIIHLSQQQRIIKNAIVDFLAQRIQLLELLIIMTWNVSFFCALRSSYSFLLRRFHRRRPLFASIRASLNPLPSRQIFSVINFIFLFIYSDAISQCQHPVKVLKINPIQL